MTTPGRTKGDGRRDERALVRAMLAGDEAAFDAFADDYLPALYREALRRTRDRELAREIAQATISKALGKLATWRGEAGLTTWLQACCRNQVAMHFRSRSRSPTEVPWAEERDGGEPAAGVPMVASDAPGPEGSLLAEERSDLVHRTLDALPPHYGKALEWKYLQGLPVREVARRLSLGEKAAESLLGRARAAFRDGYRRLTRRAGRPADPSAPPFVETEP